ncbi:MAG: hypothetical protein MJ058_09220 [Akkermansia sp.]|nr:hypothetical protein [Akkermansia sp.]
MFNTVVKFIFGISLGKAVRLALGYTARAIATSHRLGEMDAINHAPGRR